MNPYSSKTKVGECLISKRDFQVKMRSIVAYMCSLHMWLIFKASLLAEILFTIVMCNACGSPS